VDYTDLIQFLDDNPGLHTYGDASEVLYGHRRGGPGVGSMIKAVHNQGRHHYCVRLVKDVSDPHSHGCDSPPAGTSRRRW